MMRSLHSWVIVLFIGVAMALALPFSAMQTAPAVVQGVTGTYLSEGDDEMSWIKITERGHDDVRCEWRKFKMMQDGKVTRQGFRFDGKIKGDRLSMQTFINKPKRFVIFAEALREKGEIVLTISMEGMIFYKGRYKPSGMVDVGFAQSRFVDQGKELAQARKDAIEASISPAQAALHEEMRKNSESVRQGNQHITSLREFRRDYPKTIQAFERNSQSMGRYMQQMRGTEKLGQRAYVTQSYMQMQETLNDTYTLQNQQDEFQQYIISSIKPFIEEMRQQQKLCESKDADPETMSMCKAAASLEKTLTRQLTGMDKIFEEIRASYRKNAAAQRKSVDEARHIVNPNAVN